MEFLIEREPIAMHIYLEVAGSLWVHALRDTFAIIYGSKPLLRVNRHDVFINPQPTSDIISQTDETRA